jgi:hypothetical protein
MSRVTSLLQPSRDLAFAIGAQHGAQRRAFPDRMHVVGWRLNEAIYRRVYTVSSHYCKPPSTMLCGP